MKSRGNFLRNFIYYFYIKRNNILFKNPVRNSIVGLKYEMYDIFAVVTLTDAVVTLTDARNSQ